jgi:hypothetical protein
MLRILVISLRLAGTSEYPGRDFISGKKLMPPMERGLINSKPCPENPSLRIPPEIQEKILYPRRTYHLGQLRISWFLDRYHGIKVSSQYGPCFGIPRETIHPIPFENLINPSAISIIGLGLQRLTERWSVPMRPTT